MFMLVLDSGLRSKLMLIHIYDNRHEFWWQSPNISSLLFPMPFEMNVREKKNTHRTK